MSSILFINSLILIGILFFTFNFENYYIKQLSINMYNLIYKIENKIESLNNEINGVSIYEIVKGENISIDIIDNIDKKIVFTNKLNLDYFLLSTKDNLSKQKNIEYDTLRSINNQKYHSYIGKDRENVEFLIVEYTTESELYTINIRTQIASIKNSINTVLKFLMIIFIPIMLVSIILGIYLSKRFTKPIIELNNITDEISKLNFNKKSNINTDDEIETLGNNINKLSNEIEKSLKDLKVKNQDLKILIDDKEQKEILRREFVSGVSHELKTPITIISGYTQALLENIITDKESINYYLETILNESNNMEKMVLELLELYKLESRTSKLKIEKVNLKDLIHEISKKFEYRLNDINLVLETDNVEIECDKFRISQVINNYLDNAIHHINNENTIKISVNENIDDIFISVFNTGDTISDINKIWYSFSQLDESRSSNRIGLGLSICREILSMHNFNFGVLNKDNGVEFYFIIKK